MIDDRPSLQERYGNATRSSHLEVKPTRCSVDYLIAAGWTDDNLGVRLFRLRDEYDSIRAEHRMAEANLKAEVVAAWKAKPEDKTTMIEEAARAALIARALIMVRLKTLEPARSALYGFALATAVRSGFPRKNRDNDGIVRMIVGRCLDAWLDPLCHDCDGRGFNGSPGSPMVICTSCNGSGRRHVRLAHDESGHEFGSRIMAEMDRKTARVASMMQRWLSSGG